MITDCAISTHKKTLKSLVQTPEPNSPAWSALFNVRLLTVVWSFVDSNFIHRIVYRRRPAEYPRRESCLKEAEKRRSDEPGRFFTMVDGDVGYHQTEASDKFLTLSKFVIAELWVG